MLTAQTNGRAVSVDISNFETQEGSIYRRLAFLLGAAYNGRLARREGTQRLSPVPTGIYPVADGYVQIITIPAWVPRMLATLDDPGLAEHFSTDAWLIDPETPSRCDEVLYPWLLTRTRQEAMEAAEANKWPVTALNPPVELLDDRHFTERGFLVEVDHPAGFAAARDVAEADWDLADGDDDETSPCCSTPAAPRRCPRRSC